MLTIIGALVLLGIVLWIAAAVFRSLAEAVENMNFYQWLMVGLMLACGAWYYKAVYEPQQETELATKKTQEEERTRERVAQEIRSKKQQEDEIAQRNTAQRKTTLQGNPRAVAPSKAAQQVAQKSQPTPQENRDINEVLDEMYGANHAALRPSPTSVEPEPIYVAPAEPVAAVPYGYAPPSYGQGPMPALDMGRPVHVDGYTRKDGTYVRPHTRSAPGHGRRH
jgi:hypothetical protein